MRKKYMFSAALFAAAMLSASACGTQTPAPESVPTETSIIIETADTNAPDAAETSDTNSSEQSSISGTIDEIKDFMFILTTDGGVSYVLSFDSEKPQGLDSVAAGDKVTVTYTGVLSDVDAFTGTIISVEKAG